MNSNPNNYNYKEELAIDSESLDYEWLMQPQVFIKYAELYSDAEIRFDKSKDRLEYIRAELDCSIRNNPVLLQGKKLTEAQVNSLILTDVKYKSALEEMHEAKKAFRRLGMAVKAFEQRKSALENLVKLHGQSYFASPRVENRTLSESISDAERRRDEAHKKVKDRLDKGKCVVEDSNI